MQFSILYILPLPFDLRTLIALWKELFWILSLYYCELKSAFVRSACNNNTMQFDSIQHVATKLYATLFNEVNSHTKDGYDSMQSVQCNAFNVMQPSAIYCNTLQYIAIQCDNIMDHCVEHYLQLCHRVPNTVLSHRDTKYGPMPQELHR